ncbi:carboxypeptidase-like regulatory domain-containing protein [Sphingobacterium alkalisoli]|uniref:Carboxypeptidase-like regulatory domain-containing protein n=1 Tax=Sphingobacterium alkalisoli TaxID=1874115 RepID=A0A4U0H4L7_9SPHI|nr:carboxypeptidase-like regulatory domain-containing protein [Sphingobacterium alkalisoli]TJY66653.1 carboxypeptidase-like regulatory domain-containing protein [Sphingobacterium alkalisoli]GGH15049.1 hypothetical protein GCM10011418_16450 [Sphingobacterium alkalisoli]
MKTELSLNIDRPCGEHWSGMPEDTNGRYCDRCAKSIIDMVNLSDEEIVELIAQNPSKICARLSTYQINRPIIIKSKKRLPFYKIVSGLFLISSASSAFATQKLMAPKELMHDTINRKDDSISITKSSESQDSMRNIIQGMVSDASDNKGLSNVLVLVRGTNIGTVTDENGGFKFNAPTDMPIKDIILEVNHLGYLSTSVHAYNKSKRTATCEIFLTPDNNALIGEVCIIKRKKWWQFWR